MHPVGEAGGDDDDTRRDGDKRVEQADVQRLAEKRAVASDVAAEDRHRADAEREREERMVHRLDDHLDDADGLHARKVGDEIEREPGRAAVLRVQAQAVHGEDDNEHKEAEHESLRHALNALLETGHADARRGRRHRKHRRRHGQRIAEHTAERRADGGGIEADERAGRHAREVDEHPARDRRVEHHEDDVAEETRDAVQPPHLGLLRRQRRMEAHDRPLGGASGGELHEENRQADQRERDEVKYDEPTAAVLPGDVGETPDVAEANRAPSGQENEAQAAR